MVGAWFRRVAMRLRAWATSKPTTLRASGNRDGADLACSWRVERQTMDESEGASPDPTGKREPTGPKREPAADKGSGRGGTTPEKGAPQKRTPEESAPQPTPLTQQIGRVVVLLLLVLFVVFALDNAQPVDFSWVLGDTQVREDVAGETTGGVPLILLLLASFAVGASVGAVGVWQVRRARRRDAANKPSGGR